MVSYHRSRGSSTALRLAGMSSVFTHYMLLLLILLDQVVEAEVEVVVGAVDVVSPSEGVHRVRQKPKCERCQAIGPRFKSVSEK